MVKVYSIDGVTPVVHPSSFVHPSAVLIGDVIIGPGCYIGPCASLRGDFGRIIIGAGANVQDNCTIHGFPEHDTLIEDDGHIGHGAILHCCHIGRNAMVGMNAVIMDQAEIGESAIVASMAFVKAAMVVPPRCLVAGIPARIVRDLSAKEMAWKVTATALYQQLAQRSADSMQAVESLAEAEPGRKRIVLAQIKPLVVMKAEWAELDEVSGLSPAPTS